MSRLMTTVVVILVSFFTASAAEKGVNFSHDGESFAVHAATDGEVTAIVWVSYEGLKYRKGFITVFNSDDSIRCTASIELRSDLVTVPSKTAIHSGKIYVAGELREENPVAGFIASFDRDCKPAGEALLVSAETSTSVKDIVVADGIYTPVEALFDVYIVKLDQNLNPIWYKSSTPIPQYLSDSQQPAPHSRDNI